MENSTKIALAVAGVILVGGGITTPILVVRAKRATQFSKLIDAINTDGHVTGTYNDLGAKGSPFDTSLYLGATGLAKLPWATALDYAKRIHDAKGFTRMFDDRDKVMAIFKNMTSQHDISKLSFAYYQTYKTDLFDYLNSFMENTIFGISNGHNYMVDINDIVKKLPLTS